MRVCTKLYNITCYIVFVFVSIIFLPEDSVAQQSSAKGEFLWDPILYESYESNIGSLDYLKLREFPHDSLEYKLGQKVAYIEIPGESFTGFLVGNDLLLTNHHCVYNSRNEPYLASSMMVYMEYWNDRDKGVISSRVTHILKSNEYLDYALLQLSEPLGLWYGYLELETNVETLRRVKEVKIIQHPKQRSKEIVIENTTVTALKPEMSPEVIHYIADTDEGSSGSPVFSRTGDKVIALHHRGFSLQTDRQEYNEGIVMARIFEEIYPWLDSPTSSSPTRPSSSSPPVTYSDSEGMGTGTKVAIGIGAAAAVGGVVAAIMANSESNNSAEELNLTISATATGSTQPQTTTSSSMNNGDFLITVGETPGTDPVIGDGKDESTTWRFNFTGDSNYRYFTTSRQLTSALLTLTLTPHDVYIDTDVVNIMGLSAISMGAYNLTLGSITTLEIQLLDFYDSAEILTVLNSNAGRIPMYYGDDAILSYARLDLKIGN